MALGWSLVWNVVRYSGFSAFASFGGRYPRSIFTVGGEDTVETGQVDSGLGNQSDQPGDKVQRFKYDMGSAVAPGCSPKGAYFWLSS